MVVSAELAALVAAEDVAWFSFCLRAAGTSEGSLTLALTSQGVVALYAGKTIYNLETHLNNEQ